MEEKATESPINGVSELEKHELRMRCLELLCLGRECSDVDVMVLKASKMVDFVLEGKVHLIKQEV